MEVDFAAVNVQRDHGIEPGQQQSVGNANFTAGHVDRNHTVAQDVFTFADGGDEVHHPGQFAAQELIQSVSPVTDRTDRLKIRVGHVDEIEPDHAVALSGETVKIKLRFGGSTRCRRAHRGSDS